MSDIFELGFRIDTTPLAAARTAAEGAAAAVGKLGDAEEALARKARAAEDALKRTTDAQKGSTSSTTGLGDALGGLSGKIGMNAAELQRLAAMLGSAGGGGLGGALGAARTAASAFGATLGPVGVGAVAAVTSLAALGAAAYSAAKPFAEAQDKAALLEARLKNSLGSTYAARDAIGALAKMAAETGLGFTASADAFLRFARANDTLGATRGQLLQFTETIQKLGAISGAGLGETQSALMQLGQALSSGKLQGDELRSIGENAPAILKAIAEGLGRTTGEIRAMGAAGELSTTKIFEAVNKATEKTRKEFLSLPDTSERASQRVADQYDRLFATLGEKWNASGFVRSVRNTMAEILEATNAALSGPTAAESMTSARQGVLAGAGAGNRAALISATSVLNDRSASADEKLAAQEAIDRILEARIERLGPGNPLVQQYLAARRGLETQAVSAEADAETQAAKKRTATMDGGLSTGREYDEFQSKLTKLAEARAKINAAIDQARRSAETGITSGGDATERDQATAALPLLQRQLQGLEADARKAEPALAKLSRSLADAREALRSGGGGGGTSLMTEALAALRAAEATQGIGLAGGLGDFVAGKGNERAVSIREQTIELARQLEQQRAMTGAVGGSRDSIVSLETAQRLANEEFKFLGGPNSPARQVPDLVAAYKAYAAVIRDTAAAAEEQRRAESRLADASRSRLVGIGLANVGNEAAGRRAAAEERAREAERTQGGGAGARSLSIYEIEERTRAATQIDALGRSTALAGATGGLSARGKAAAELEDRVDAARRGTDGSSEKNSVEAAIRADALAKERAGYADAETSLRNQRRLIEDRVALVGLSTEEYRVQTALLERRSALEAEGAPSDVVERQISITEQIERQTIAYEKQRQRVEDIFSIVDSGATASRSLLVNSFAESFKSGEFSAKKFFDGLSDMAARAGAELVYEIGVKPFVTMAANMAKVGISKYFSLGGDAGGGDAIGGGLLEAASGAAFDSGGVRRFAKGGTFTNSIVTSPTMFRFANGGALGEMGEAGPEAIMPLRRGPDGRLGVSGAGGGGGDVTVVVNDYRSAKDSSPATVEQGTGPDGKKMISIMIRDEVKRAMRSGEMDRDMQANYGSSRSVQRK